VSVVVASYEGSKPVRRGWAVLIAAAIGIFMTVPGQTVGVAPFVDHIAADLDIPREWVIVTYSLGTLLGILPAPFFGRVLDRYSPRGGVRVDPVHRGTEAAGSRRVESRVEVPVGGSVFAHSKLRPLSQPVVTRGNPKHGFAWHPDRSTGSRRGAAPRRAPTNAPDP
jgi:hypothetical protein